MFKRFLKIIVVVYIYQFARFGGLVVQKIYSKMHPVSCTNTHHDVTDFVNHGMVKNTKIWISWEHNVTFLRNQTILNMYLIWHILKSYRFVAEVTCKNQDLTKRENEDNHSLSIVSWMDHILSKMQYSYAARNGFF